METRQVSGADPPQLHFHQGLQFYREGDFSSAVREFCIGLAADSKAWEVRLYLGMAYARLNQHREAKQEFITVRDFCPNAELRQKATSALNALSPLKK